MNKTQALKEAVRRWGKDAMIQDRPQHASTPEEREEARKQRDQLYKTLTKEEQKARRKEIDALLWKSLHQRFAVGVFGGFFFGVRGVGDTWEECFQHADRLWSKAA